MLMAMSILQDGSGFAFIAPPVYKYICGQDITEISIVNEDVPDYEASALLRKVSRHKYHFRVRHVVYSTDCMYGPYIPKQNACMDLSRSY